MVYGQNRTDVGLGDSTADVCQGDLFRQLLSCMEVFLFANYMSLHKFDSLQS